jgi:hypothetical protein
MTPAQRAAIDQAVAILRAAGIKAEWMDVHGADGSMIWMPKMIDNGANNGAASNLHNTSPAKAG